MLKLPVDATRPATERQRLRGRGLPFAPWLVSLWHVVEACRVSVLLIVAGAVALTTSQGSDALRALLDSPPRQRFLLVIAVAAYGFGAWYFGRSFTTYAHALPPVAPGHRSPPATVRATRFWAAHLPRWLGALAPATVGAAVFAAVGTRGLPLGGSCLGLAILLLLFTYQRRPLGRALDSRIGGNPRSSLRLLRAPLGEPSIPLATYERFRDLPGRVRIGLVAVACAGFAAMAAFAAAPVRLAPFFGPLTLLVAGLTVWLALGNYAVFFGLRARAPVLSLALLWAVLISPCNDNHRVRAIVPRADWQRPTTAELFEGFIERQPASEPTHPVVIVAAEGGGIRAAYWTASILARFQDSEPAFSRRLFAISGVSGGSLGATVFAATLRHGLSLSAPGRCGERGLECCVREILAADHLSPTLGMLFFPDSLQRFLPFPVAAMDRSRGLEGSWAHAFQSVTGFDQLGHPYDELAPVFLDQGRPLPAMSDLPLPALYLNATAVESGQRIVVAPVDVATEQALYVDALDGVGHAGGTLSASTAAHLSARFPYVSPVGLVPATGKASGHVADGGYFEGSGAATALEILKAVSALAEAKHLAWKPIVLLVTNDVERDVKPDRWLTEVLGPPRALLATHGAYSTLAMHELRNLVTREYGGVFLALNVPGADLKVPLGWMLSPGSIGALNERLDEVARSDDVRSVLALLRDDSPRATELPPLECPSGHR